MGLNLFEKNVRKMTAPGRYGGVYGASGDNTSDIIGAYNDRVAAQKRAREANTLRSTQLANQASQYQSNYEEDRRRYEKDFLESQRRWDANRNAQGNTLNNSGGGAGGGMFNSTMAPEGVSRSTWLKRQNWLQQQQRVRDRQATYDRSIGKDPDDSHRGSMNWAKKMGISMDELRRIDPIWDQSAMAARKSEYDRELERLSILGKFNAGQRSASQSVLDDIENLRY